MLACPDTTNAITGEAERLEHATGALCVKWRPQERNDLAHTPQPGFCPASWLHSIQYIEFKKNLGNNAEIMFDYTCCMYLAYNYFTHYKDTDDL